MRTLLALAFILLPGASLAQVEEDAEHRADRVRTEQLNRNAAAAAARRENKNADSIDRYRDAQAAYQRAREQWRRKLAACEDGDDRACAPY